MIFNCKANKNHLLRSAIASLTTIALLYSHVSSSAPRFERKTSVIENFGEDLSEFLGSPNLNQARTKDADIGDINNDGWPDILDANSNNTQNGTNMIARINKGSPGNDSFEAVVIGPRDTMTSYDVDLADLNADGFVDMIRTEAVGNTRRVSVYLNTRTSPWFNLSNPSFRSDMDFCPDDLAFGDLNNDGSFDFAVSQRLRGACSGASGTSVASVFINNGQGTNFTLAQEIEAPNNESMHDVFFIDANDDGRLDIFTVNEDGTNRSRLHLNNGGAIPSFTATSQTFITALAGTEADLNLDGLTDFVLAGVNSARVYLNNPANPGNFINAGSLPEANAGAFYDIEIEDYDVDGDLDIIAVSISGANSGEFRYWDNNFEATGNVTFSRITDRFNTPFRGFVGNQALSVDAIDYDRDGDKDVYITGGDGQNLGCFGCVPNQFYENLSVNVNFETFGQGAFGRWFQDGNDVTAWRAWQLQSPSSGTGPSGASNGLSYLLFETSAGFANAAGDTATFTSPRLLGRSSAFKFDYHMFGSDIGSLSVDVYSGGAWINDVWSISGQQHSSNDSDWTTVTVDLSSIGGPAFIRLRAVADGGFRGDIAVDNLRIIPETTPINTFEAIVDDFEEGLGRWQQSGGDTVNWTRQQGGTPSSITGPLGANRNNYYLYMETSSGQANSAGNTAILTSEAFESTGGRAVTFDYHMVGSNIGTLSLQVRQVNRNNGWEEVWSATGAQATDQATGWQTAFVDLFIYFAEDLQFRFVATAAGGWQGDIAIDNIRLSGTRVDCVIPVELGGC